MTTAIATHIRDAVRYVGHGLWKAHLGGAGLHHDRLGWRSLLSCRRPRRLGAGCRRAPRGESFNRAATHRAARGTPRGAHVRKAAFGLPPDGCGGGGPRARGPDGSVVAPAGDAGLRPRPERARASAGDTGTDPRDTLAHAGLRRFRASPSGYRD